MARIDQNSYESPNGGIWRCPDCETLNTENKCIMCGYERVVHPDKKKCPKCGYYNDSNANFCAQCAHKFIAPKPPKPRIPVKLIGIAGVVLIVLVALICLLGRNNHTHSWAEATCMAPQTCTICGETTGEKADHDWMKKTCEKPKTCRICGETSGVAAGHKWKEATYDAPKTCTVCKATRGEPLETQPAEQGESLRYTKEKVKIKNANVTAKVLEHELKQCKQMTVSMYVEMKHGTKCTDWQVWVRRGGSFEAVADIYLPNGNGSTTETIYFDIPINFDAIAIVPTVPGSYSWSMSFSVTDIDCQ